MKKSEVKKGGFLFRKIVIAVLGTAVVALLLAAFILIMLWVRNSRPYNEEYYTAARQGYYTEELGTVKRNIPAQTRDEGLSFGYPEYGKTYDYTEEQKNQLIQEAYYLTSKATLNSSGTYDKMDKDGNLYLADGTPVLDGQGNQRKLYKHTASATMYYGQVSDDEKAVIKRITFQPRTYSSSYSVTGLYAPAGEVIKLEMSGEDFSASGGITVHIGQALYNGQANNIWAAKTFCRMPVVLNTMLFDESTAEYDENTKTYTCYVGSYLGGPIYVRNTSVPVTVTISGGVNYRHFILGKTTEKEFKALSKSTAPYFDLEIWDSGVLHSGPLETAGDFTYGELYDAAVLWEKVSLVSTQVREQCIVNIYDPFVAAGAAVAFPGRASTNCPAGWLKSALDYQSFITSGSWGVMHEYNHNFQGWGLPDGGEVTNNALNLVSYVSFTEISSARTLTAAGEGGLSGWNAYTSPSRALNMIKDGMSGVNQLAIYANIMHNIGTLAFMQGVKASGTDDYYKAVCEASGYDMTYFFKELCQVDPDDGAVEEIKAKNYPAFVPAACVYQTGRSTVGGTHIKTAMPFAIEYGAPFTVDLGPYTVSDGYYNDGSIVLPNGFSYKIKSVSQPEHGKIEREEGNVYTFTPDNNAQSGEIIVTLEITKDDGAFTVDDIELVLEFVQSHEINKSVLQRTVYTYSSLPYGSASAAYEANYAGYTEVREEDNTNPTQNSNTDVWVPNPANNAIMEVRGKLLVTEDGDYRVALRGRHHAALYLSSDGKEYHLAAELNHTTNKNDWWLDEGSGGYEDLKGLKAGDWIYFKEVLIVDYAGAFIGLGWGKFQPAGGTMNDDGEYVDDNGNVIPEIWTADVAYAAAYRSTYLLPEDEFESGYLFTRTRTYTLDNSNVYESRGSLVASSGYTKYGNYELGNLFDAEGNSFIHTAAGSVTEQTPFDITVDLGESVTANKLTVYGRQDGQWNAAEYLPKNFVLYGGTDTSSLIELANVSGAQRTGNTVAVNFDRQIIRYYRFVCTAPYGTNCLAISRLQFADGFTLADGVRIAPNDPSVSLYGKWKKENSAEYFGSSFFGKRGSSLKFTLTGTRFAVLSAAGCKTGFTVYIDGKQVNSAYMGADPDKKGIAYLSPELTEGGHKVKIVSGSAKTPITSLLYWKQ